MEWVLAATKSDESRGRTTLCFLVSSSAGQSVLAREAAPGWMNQHPEEHVRELQRTHRALALHSAISLLLSIISPTGLTSGAIRTPIPGPGRTAPW